MGARGAWVLTKGTKRMAGHTEGQEQRKLPRGSRAVLRVSQDFEQGKWKGRGKWPVVLICLHYWRIGAFSILRRKLILSSE